MPLARVAAERTIVAQQQSIAADRIENLTYYAAPVPEAPWQRVQVGEVPALASAFQPRTGLLQRFDQAPAEHATVVLTQVLSGGGGVGKSQLAAAQAHRAHTQGVEVLVWVNAAETVQVVAAYASAAHRVKAPGADGQNPESDARAFLDWLADTEHSWLVVLDDLTDVEGCGPWWPRPSAAGNGRVLATTRRRDALVSSGGRAVIDVGTYTPDEALAYLRDRFTSVQKSHLLDHRTEELVRDLGGLPLALAHAAAYMINEDEPCDRYLELFTDRQSRLDTLLSPKADTEGYGRQITASLLLALDAAQQREPVGLAAPAIRLASYLDPAGHPQNLWTTTAATEYLTAHRTTPPAHASQPADASPEQAHDVLRLLHQYGLLTSDSQDGHRAVRLHALTARAARETTPATQTPATVRAAANALNEIWPENDYATPDLSAVLRANTDFLAAEAGDLLWPESSAVMYHAGRSLLYGGLYTAALTHWRHLAADATRLLGADHPDTLAACGGLALSYRQVGRTAEAITMEEQVLADATRLLGTDHPDTLRARGNLALSYRQAARTAEAITIAEQVVADFERLLGTEHADTIRARGNLADFYRQVGRMAEAITLLEQVVTDRERVLGEEHPDTLAALDALREWTRASKKPWWRRLT